MQKTSFGQRLRSAFGNAKYAEIADKIGVSEATVKVYMAGRVPDEKKLLTITESTNCNLHWLLTGEGPQKVDHHQDIELKDKLTAKLRAIADEQAQYLFSHADVAAGNVASDRAFELLTTYLLNEGLRSFNLLAPGEWLMSPQDRKLAERFTFVRDRQPTIEDQIRNMIAHSAPAGADDEMRAIIRELVQEEVSRSRKRPVYPLHLKDEDTEEEQTPRRKAG